MKVQHVSLQCIDLRWMSVRSRGKQTQAGGDLALQSSKDRRSSVFHKTFEYRANLCANEETLDLAGKRVSKTRVINQSAINSFWRQE